MITATGEAVVKVKEGEKQKRNKIKTLIEFLMHDKLSIAKNWLPRYTGTQVEDFGRYVILTNFRIMLPNLLK